MTLFPVSFVFIRYRRRPPPPPPPRLRPPPPPPLKPEDRLLDPLRDW